MNNRRCKYSRVVSGTCEQQVLDDTELCYYHTKVRAGLIETDEKAAIYDMPTMRR